MIIGLKPNEGIISNFDFDISIEKDDLSASSSKIVFEGNGFYQGNSFNFSGPISKFKLQYGLGTKHRDDLNYEAYAFLPKDYVMEIGAIKADIPDDAKK